MFDDVVIAQLNITLKHEWVADVEPNGGQVGVSMGVTDVGVSQ